MSIESNNSIFEKLDLSLLRYFFVIATFGGFSKASRATGVSQPSLSLGLKRLEKSLSIVLIKRDSRQFELTEAGLTLLNFCQRLEGNLQSVVESFGGNPVGHRRRLRIGSALSIGFAPLASACNRSTQLDEPLELELSTKNTFNLLEELGEGTLDAALVPDDVYDRNLTFRKVAQEQLIFVAGKVFERQFQGADFKAAVEGLALLTYPRETPMRALIDRLRSKHMLHFKTSYSVNGIEALKMLVTRGVGGAFLMHSLVSAELKNRTIFEPELPFVLPRLGMMLATRAGEPGDAVARLILELMSDAANAA